MTKKFSQLSASAIDQLIREKTVFFFPVGPLEDHGPHLPINLDLLESLQLCNSTAKYLEEKMRGWTSIIMPDLPLGVDSNTSRIAITIRPHVLRDWLVDSCNSLISLGFLHFVCFSGHLGPRQLTAIEDASKIIGYHWFGIRKKGNPNLSSASSALVKLKEVLLSPLWPNPSEHGGKRDTSVAITILNENIDPLYKALPHLQKTTSQWKRLCRSKKISGYWGNPSESTLELGNQELKTILETVFPKLQAVWEGTKPKYLFTSWYSLFPPNKSFFKAWIIGISILIILIGYFLLDTA